jgi:hypothetical protein
MTFQGYPQFVIFLVLGIGIPLAILRPYKAFLLAVLLLTAGNVKTFNQTRTSLLGPYLNLGDACLLVALVALFFDKFRSKRRLRLPLVVPVLLFVLTIAACQSFWWLGWTYETARAYRWALQTPLAFLIGANLVSTPARAKGLIGALLCGAVLAAVQHLYYVWAGWRPMNQQAYAAIRTIAYWGGCMSSAFLVTAVIWKLPANMWKKIAFLTVGVLFLTTVFLNQTRSLWFATAGAAICLLVLFKIRNRIIHVTKLGIIVVLTVLTMALVSHYVMPGLDVLDITISRINLLFEGTARSIHIGTRERAFKAEMASWLNGTLIFGRGLCFFQTIRNPENETKHIAFGHLGYVTYLSQMGLIGLLAYGFYFPLTVLRDARFLWWHGGDPMLRYLGLLGTASILCLSIMFLMSSCFLGDYFAPCVLYGSMWLLARSQKRTPHKESARISQSQQE